MAVLSNEEMRTMWSECFRKGGDKDAFKGDTNPSLSGDDVRAALQAIEDTWEAGRTKLKQNMDAAAGVTLSNAQAKALGRVWLKLKAEREKS